MNIFYKDDRYYESKQENQSFLFYIPADFKTLKLSCDTIEEILFNTDDPEFLMDNGYDADYELSVVEVLNIINTEHIIDDLKHDIKLMDSWGDNTKDVKALLKEFNNILNLKKEA